MKLKFLLVASALLLSVFCQAQTKFTIATGGTGGTYFPVAGMIASAINKPGKLALSVQASPGSEANVKAISSGEVDSGFAQADIANWAYKGSMAFEGKTRQTRLRLIASLYPETIHVVVKKGSGIGSVADLKGKRVSLGPVGSGILATTLMVLKAHGVKEAEVFPEYVRTFKAADMLQDGELDAFFFVGGAPARAIEDMLASGTEIELIPIEGEAAAALRKQNPYFFEHPVPEGVYAGVPRVPTLAVSAQWFTGANADPNVIYQITKSLFSESVQKALKSGHAKGKLILPQSAVIGASIPLHPGAAKFYKEAGLLE